MGRQQITRVAAWKLAKVILHEMCEKVGHYPFRAGYSFMCNGERIAVKSAMFGADRAAWVWWIRKIDADKIMFVAFDRDGEVEYVWLMPASVLREDGRFMIRENEVDDWAEYEVDIGKFGQMVYKV